MLFFGRLIAKIGMPYLIAAIATLFLGGGGVIWYKKKMYQSHNQGMNTLFTGYVGIARKRQKQINRNADEQSRKNAKNDAELVKTQDGIRKEYEVKQ